MFCRWFPTSQCQGLPEGIPDDVWWDSDPSQPIVISAAIELDEATKQQLNYVPSIAIVGIEIDKQKNAVSWKVIDEQTVHEFKECLGLKDPATLEALAVPRSDTFMVLAPKLRSGFSLLPAARDKFANPNSFIRSPLIDDNTLNSWRSMAQPWQRRQRMSWDRFRDDARNVLSHWNDFQVIQNEPVLGSGENATHLRDTGGGSQSVLRILSDIGVNAQVLAIEEPENHLHPELVKRVTYHLRHCGKQVFLTTHSPFVVDANKVEEVWQAQYLGRETKLTNLKTMSELWEVLHRLGVRPSDFLYSDLLLLVEGESDRVFYETLLMRKGVGKADALVFLMHSGDKIEYSVDAWLTQFRFHGNKPFIIVDKSAGKRPKMQCPSMTYPRIVCLS